jgi:hypothetical protein
MGAQKMSSSELNNMLLKDNNTLQDINNKISNIKEDMSTKMTIIGHEMAYSSSLLNNYKAGLLTNDKTLIALSRSSNTQFTTYGPVAHSAFIKEPVNVFNLKVSGTGEYFFRNDITVAVNGLISEKYRDVLKHDSLPKEVFFNEYTSPNVTITLTAAEISQKLGPTVFNMVELDSFLNGSYDIKSFKVYKLNLPAEEIEYSSGVALYVPSSLRRDISLFLL